MYLIQKIFFIFCAIPFIKAVSLKIDGLIDLGPNWSYEYRILGPGGTANRDVERNRNENSNQEQDDKPQQRIDPDEQERMRKDEERLNKAEERFREEAAELRKTAHHDSHKTPKDTSDSKHNDKKTSVEEEERKSEKKSKKKRYDDKKTLKHGDGEYKKKKSHDDKKKDKSHDKKDKEYDKKDKDHDKKDKSYENKEKSEEHSEEKNYTPKKVTFSSKSEDSSSLIDSEEATEKRGTKFDMYDFTTPKKPRKRPIDPYEPAPEKYRESSIEEKHGLVNEDAASFIDERAEKPIKRQHLNQTDSEHAKNGNSTEKTTIVTVRVTNATKPTTTVVTTVRTGEIYDNETHKIKNDAKVTDFTNHLYKQTLKVFDVVKEKTGQYHVKKQIDELAKSYEDKFKEFLAETKSQKIKTRLGTQKVILNTIDMSNRILRRLINFMIGDMDKRGVLRHNVATANIFQKEIEKEQNLELGHACKKFGICRSGKGFPDFLTNILNILLRCDDRKFKQAVDALTEVIKNTNYHNALEGRTERKLKDGVDRIERLPVRTLRPMFTIIKNIITNKNKPLIIENLTVSHRVNATLALLEIIDLLDQKMPRNESNALEWIDIENSLKDYADNKRYDVQEIMEVIVKTIRKTLKGLDRDSQRIVSKNLNIIFG